MNPFNSNLARRPIPNRSDASREVELSDRERALDRRAKALDAREALINRRETDLLAPSEAAPRRESADVRVFDDRANPQRLSEAQISAAAAAIIRAGQKARGELDDDDEDLNSIHPVAKAIVLAGRCRRGEIE